MYKKEDEKMDEPQHRWKVSDLVSTLIWKNPNPVDQKIKSCMFFFLICKDISEELS